MLQLDKKSKAIINCIFLAVTLVVNGLGAFGWINRMTQKNVSDHFKTPITPEPSTFMIWILIYILLFLFVGMCYIRNSEFYQELVDEITLPFVLSCIFNIFWIISFSFEQIITSTVLIALYTLSLLWINWKLLKLTERHLLSSLAFGINAGWAMLATAINVTMMFVQQGVTETKKVYLYSAIMLILAAVIITILTQVFKNATFPLPAAWGFLGIYNELRFGINDYKWIQILTILGLIYFAFIAIIRCWLNKYRILPQIKERRRKE